MTDLLVVIPLYKSPELIPELFASLAQCADEIVGRAGRVLLINDSPDDGGLAAALVQHLPALAAALTVDLQVNDANLGFIGAANLGLEVGRATGANVLLLNSDALLTKGAVEELASVAETDPMIAVVSPRSNNATICNSPYPERFRGLARHEALAAHQALQGYLPRVTYAPTAVGFCLFIRHAMLEEFGLFDPVYGDGYNEENDFIMRCNRRGYRAVLANHAFVFHLGSVSFDQTAVAPRARDRINRAILLERYPEYERSVIRYFAGVEYRAQTLAAGLVPGDAGRLRLVFDCRNMAPIFNGTFELARRLVAAFVEKYAARFDCFVAIGEAAYRFHGFGEIEDLTWCSGEESRIAPFAVAFRVAQPFETGHLVEVAALAPIVGFMMLDTIALDCQDLDETDLGGIWSKMLRSTELLGFISDFSRDEFKRRFSVPTSVTQFVSLCSTDVADYGRQGEGAKATPGSILVVGNHYPHKNVAETLDRLMERADGQTISVLGVEIEGRPDIASYRAGEVDQDTVDELYDRAEVILFPSHYEGFGLPIMHALARGKVVIARDMPAARQIKAHTPSGANIHLFATTAAMVDAALSPPRWQEAAVSTASVQTWEHAADALATAIDQAIRVFDLAALRRRLEAIGDDAGFLHVAEPAVAGASEQGRRFPAPTALPRPADDAVFHAGEYGAVLVRRLVTTLARIPGLTSLGSLFWTTRRRGRRLRLSLGDSLAGLEPGGYGEISADALDPQLSAAELAEAILDWAALLTPGGRLTLNTRKDETAEEISPLQPSGLRYALLGAGLYPESLDTDERGLSARALKAADWTAFLPGPEQPDNFVEGAFQWALGRAPGGYGQEHALNVLAEGGSRHAVLRHLLASPERAYQISRQNGQTL